MRLLRAADRVAKPWKNGGGVTRDVATFPSGADVTNFDWRISIADVHAAGPFSCFVGIDRIRTVLNGRLTLRFVESGETVMLDPGNPFAFSGDVAVEGEPMNGLVRDLNVMVRRGLWRAEVKPWQAGQPAIGNRIAIATSACAGIQPLDALILPPGANPPPDFVGLVARFNGTSM